MAGKQVKIPVGRFVAISILVGVGVFTLYLGVIMLLIIAIGLQSPPAVLALIAGSILCFAGMGLASPSMVSLGALLSSHARDSASKLSSYLSRAGADLQGASMEIGALRANRPSFLSSLKISTLSMILLFLLILSLIAPLDILLRLALLFTLGPLAPVAIIASIYSLVEELLAWLQTHSALEASVLSRIPGHPGLQPQSPRRISISTGIFLSIATLGLYMVYSLPASMIELGRHMEWHDEVEEALGSRAMSS